MFLTRLNRIASAWKSSDARMRWSASGDPPRAERDDVAGRGRAAHDLDRGGRAARAHSARARARTRRRPAATPGVRAPNRFSPRHERTASIDLAIDAGQLRQIHQDPNDAVHLPAQAERIARAGRLLAGTASARRPCRACRPATPPPRSPPPARAAPATAARRPRRRSAGTGGRSPSRPARAALLRARRCRPSSPAARGTRTPCRSSDRPSPAAPPGRVLGRDLRPPEHVARQSTRRASRSAPPCRDSCRASCGRATVCRRSSRDSSVCLRSASQKNFASRSRAATTRSAFFAMSALVRRLGVDDREERFLERARSVTTGNQC